jgi:hypothetical protein
MDAHTDTRIVLILAFAGLSHVTYCHEMRDMNIAVRVRVTIILERKKPSSEESQLIAIESTSV